MATSRHLRKRASPTFEKLQFRLAFRKLQVRSRFWFRGYLARHHIAHAAFGWRSGIRSKSLSPVQSQYKIMDGVTPFLGSLFLIPTTLVTYCTCNCASSTAGMERISPNYIRFVACIATDDDALRRER